MSFWSGLKQTPHARRWIDVNGVATLGQRTYGAETPETNRALEAAAWPLLKAWSTSRQQVDTVSWVQGGGKPE